MHAKRLSPAAAKTIVLLSIGFSLALQSLALISLLWCVVPVAISQAHSRLIDPSGGIDQKGLSSMIEGEKMFLKTLYQCNRPAIVYSGSDIVNSCIEYGFVIEVCRESRGKTTMFIDLTPEGLLYTSSL